MSALEFIVVAPGNFHGALKAPAMAVAAARAGAIGLIDLQFVSSTGEAVDAWKTLEEQAKSGSIGLRCAIGSPWLAEAIGSPGVESAAKSIANSSANSRVILLSAGDAGLLEKHSGEYVLERDVKTAQRAGFRVLVEVVDVKEALFAENCKADAIVAKGHESGGRVGDTTTFVLIQQCVRRSHLPVFAQGGIGLYTAGAVAAAGAVGLVLDSQLYLCRDSMIPPDVRLKIERLDGSETALIACNQGKDGEVSQTRYRRVLNVSSSATFPGSETAVFDNNEIWNIGQDACFARTLALTGGTIAGAIDAIRDSVAEQIDVVSQSTVLEAGSDLARSHGTRYPIVQGAMTRVSDTSDFALKVAEGGGLPFLALSLMRGPDIEKLLEETRAKLKDMPWGVGVLGFVPQQLRQEQMEVVDRHKPPFALIAGGRPDQARALEDAGTKTYLHVPSPLLLKSFIDMGSKRFIFEGKECGGHVGPRSSFVLWESMIDVLLQSIGPRDNPSSYHVLFAGGIHDDLSAAMVATMAAPLTARGIKFGVLLGTAYLFTEEAVATGAIVEKFQKAALGCEETVLLETGPGHSIRCIDSPYKATFDRCREQLQKENKSRDQIREELELMNLGRLRIASKGLDRSKSPGSGSALESIPVEKQWQDGMYMIGQVAAMHEEVTTIARLHENVCNGGQKRLLELGKENLPEEECQQTQPEGIAIVGMSCMFPESNDIETFWQNILNKVDSIDEIPETHFDWKNFYDADPLARDKIVSKWGGFLQDIVFEPAQYGIPPSSLESIDAMQVLILEAARSALNDAGYNQRRFPRQKTSVILANAGHGPITAFYSLRSMLGWKLSDLDAETQEHIKSKLPEWSEDSFPGYLGNVTAGRVANRLDLKGINFSIDAACASSLAALYVAVSDLRSGASDVVLLGATDTHNQPGDYLSFSKTHALSPKGRCQTFDADADGIVISEGVAMLVLKRLSDAERDGDRIYAVIRGIGGSSDGRDLSLTAPRPAGQALALERAYEDAGVSPGTITLIEAHGTGTVAGDKAEVEALTTVFQKAGASAANCAIGSVKTNIGHTKAAAGLASVIKIAKSLHHKILPPTINVKNPNPACRFGEGPFYLSTETRPWFSSVIEDCDGTPIPRRAGVSAFGFGGTNFHTVLEEYIPAFQVEEPPAVQAWPAELYVWKAGSQQELLKSLKATEATALKLQAALAAQSDATSFEQQKLFELAMRQAIKTHDLPSCKCALAIVAGSTKDLLAKIERLKMKLEPGITGGTADGLADGITDLAGGVHFWQAKESQAAVAFLFPGQGSQRPNMLKDLSLFFPQLRQTIEEADAVLDGRFKQPLSKYIYPVPALTEKTKAEQLNELTDTRIAQPALGACDLAMLRLLRSFGVSPDMVAGHSFGEYVALHAAGVITESQLLDLSAERGRILAECAAENPGAMAAVSSDAESVKRLIAKIQGVYLANENAPSQCIVSGDEQSIAHALDSFKGSNIACKKISVSAAFHSPLMNPSKEPLQQALLRCEYAPPAVPVYSNTTIEPYEGNAQAIVSQLAEHALKPVQFAKQLERMHSDGARIFLEVGPGSVLTGLTEATLRGKEFVAFNLERTAGALEQFLNVLGFLLVRGIARDVRPLYWNRMPFVQENAPESTPAKAKLQYRVNSVKIERVGQETDKPKTVSNQTQAQDGNQKPAPSLNRHNAKRTDAEKKTTMSEIRNQITNPPTPGPKTTSPGPSTPPPAIHNSVPRNGNINSLPTNASANPARSDGSVERVMLEFQKSMLEMTNRFLTSQENVMLAYLQSRSGGAVPHAAQISGLHQIIENVSAVQSNGGARFGSNGSQSVSAAEVSSTIESNGSNGVETGFNGTGQGYDTAAQIRSALAAGAPASEATIDSNAIGSSQAGCDDEGEAEISSGEGPLNSEFLIDNLYEIVSDRTGYPREMLDPNLDLEADLGIDSIKRVEILNNFRKLLPQATQEKVESGIEKLAVTRTLQGIIDWIQNLDNEDTAAGASSMTLQVEAGQIENVARGRVAVKVLEPVKLSEEKLAPVTLIVSSGGASSPVSDSAVSAIRAELEAKGQAVVTMPTELDGSLDDVSQRISRLKEEHGSIGSLIYLASPAVSDSMPPAGLQRLFYLAKELEQDLRSNNQGRSALVCATVLGGAFGVEAMNEKLSLEQLAEQAAIVGLTKTIAKEWTDVHVKVVDFSEKAAPETVADTLTAELFASDDTVEIGLHKGERIGLDVIETPYNSVDRGSSAEPGKTLSSSSVILVTGGARGITAEIALDLARKHQPTFVLVGRLPRPGENESPATAGLLTAKEIKTALIEQMRESGRIIQVREVERAYQQLLREREVRSTLAKLKQAGSDVRYYSVDVTDRKAFSELIDSIYETSNIDGVIHGAGIIEDAYIKDKSADSFDRVFRTKVVSALTLAEKLRFDSLGFLYLFSSVVGRTGNAGQSDYVAANEALNKLAVRLNQQHSLRIASIMWGPWQAGMAPPELEEVFASHGWSMIQPADGRACFYEELVGHLNDSEVLLVGKLKDKGNGSGESTKADSSDSSSRASALSSTRPSPVVNSLPPLVESEISAVGPIVSNARLISTAPLKFALTIDTAEHKYLHDHKFDGIPVMPMAVALEIMLEAARSVYPELNLVRVSNMDIPAGIVFHGQRKDFLIEIRPDKASPGTVGLQLYSAGTPDKLHFRCGALFGDKSDELVSCWTTPTGTRIPMKIGEFRASTETVMPAPGDLYGKWLFHGELFQGIQNISCLAKDAIAGDVRGATADRCLTTPVASPWILNPTLLDSAMQLAGVWARHFGDITVLPTGFKAIHFVGSTGGHIASDFARGITSAASYTAQIYLNPDMTTDLTCDLAMYDENGDLYIVIEGLGGIASKAFNRFATQLPAKELV